MYDTDRETDEVIMHINSIFRYADPVFRLTTAGAVRLIQFLARMVRERQLAQAALDDFGAFLKASGGKYDIMNIPETDKELLRKELSGLGIRFCIMPDLDRDDGLMQLAVYGPDRDRFGSWYERCLVSRMQGGEKGLKELRGLTRGSVSIVSFPLEGRDEGMEEDFKAMGINYARLPDLRVGDGSIQLEVANSDMGKVNQWYKLKQRDMLRAGDPLPPMARLTMEEYQQTGAMTEEAYINTAGEELKEANKKYEGKEKGEAEKIMEKTESRIRPDDTAAFADRSLDPDYVPVAINKKTLVDNPAIPESLRRKLAEAGRFCCLIPGSFDREGKAGDLLIIPLKDVYEADQGKTYIAFLDAKRMPDVLNIVTGSPAGRFSGMNTRDFAERFFKKLGGSGLSPKRLAGEGKSLAVTMAERQSQPAPPAMVRLP